MARAANLARVNLLYKSIAAVIGDDTDRWDTLFDLFDDNLDPRSTMRSAAAL